MYMGNANIIPSASAPVPLSRLSGVHGGPRLQNTLSLTMFGKGLSAMLKEYGLHDNADESGMQTNLTLRRKATPTGCRSAMNPPRNNLP
jgi:putative DNA primase/helicase